MKRTSAIRSSTAVTSAIALTRLSSAEATVKRVPADNKLSIVNPPKSARLAYPICTFTYIILPTKSSSATPLRKYVYWVMTNGTKKYGAKLLFEPVPKVVLKAANSTLKKVQS